jgi:hypothetical protein
MKLQSLLVKTLSCAAAAFLCARSQALDFSYSFLNNAGSPNTTVNAVVQGRVLGLNDNMVNFQQVTVTVDSITPDDNILTLPLSWLEFGAFDVQGGIIVSAQFSKHDPTVEIDLNTATGGRFLVNKSDFSTYYRNFNGEQELPGITFTQIPTPDSGATLSLLALSAAGITAVRRLKKS